MTIVKVSHMDVSKRVAELDKMTKAQLAARHVEFGGLMGYSTYVKWSKDELVNAVLQDEMINSND